MENRTGKEAPSHQRLGKRVETAKLTWKSEDLEEKKNTGLLRGPYYFRMFHGPPEEKEEILEILILET